MTPNERARLAEVEERLIQLEESFNELSKLIIVLDSDLGELIEEIQHDQQRFDALHEALEELVTELDQILPGDKP